MTYKPRLTKPEAKNPYYNTVAAGGYSNCIVGSPTDAGCNVLSNCVGYAKGRFNEIVGEWKYGFPGDAEDFWNNRGGLPVGQVPQVGALMVWRKGDTFDNADGAGHVAVVEIVHDNNTVTTSESAYNGAAFYSMKRTRGVGNWGMGKDYHFLGFIYNPAVAIPGGTETVKTWDGKFPVLRVGSTGDPVKALQILLNAKDCDCGEPDGILGAKTKAATMKFQLENMGEKEADGVVGDKTWVCILGF